MATSLNLGVKLAAVKSSKGQSTSLYEVDEEIRGDCGEPPGLEKMPVWDEPFFDRKPTGRKDQWICTRLSQGWLIRAHAEPRVKTFQPLHKGVPVDPEELTGKRVSVSYDESGTRTVLTDTWTTPTRNLHEPKKVWMGWTFYEVQGPKCDQLGGKFVDETPGKVPTRSTMTYGGASASENSYHTGDGTVWVSRVLVQLKSQLKWRILVNENQVVCKGVQVKAVDTRRNLRRTKGREWQCNCL